jgi:predicted helicase
MDLPKVLHTVLLRAPANLFDEFLKEAQAFYELPAHTLTEMRGRENKKVRGDIFEEFCALYLKEVLAYEVWLLNDLSTEIRELLNLPKQDMGIDIICRRNGKYTAVQCKYKKQCGRTQGVTWKQLSTFQALCAKTGPYEKHIVMTTANFVRHQGAKTEKDLSLCIGSLQKITKEQWVKMCGIEGHVLESTTSVKTLEELRAARILRFTPIIDS